MYKTLFENWKKSEIIWVSFATIALIIASCVSFQFTSNDFFSALMLVGTIFGTWGIIITNKLKQFNFIIKFVSAIILSITYFHLLLFGMAFINLLMLMPLQLHGFYKWIEHKNGGGLVHLNKIQNNRNNILIFLSLIIGSLAIYFGIHGLFDRIEFLMPIHQLEIAKILQFTDTLGAAASVVAQFLMNLCYTNQMFYWIIVNISQILVFSYLIFVENNLTVFPMLTMYIIWLINSIYILTRWNKK